MTCVFCSIVVLSCCGKMHGEFHEQFDVGFAGCCAWSGAYSLVRCLNILCDVDFVLLRMIYFYAELRSGPLPNLGARSVSTVCFCIFFCMPLLHRCADRCGVCWDEELFQFKDRVELFFGVGVKTCGCIGWRSRFVSLMSPLF